MGNLEKVKELSDNDWWRINPAKDYDYAIEWTPKLGGWVRVKNDTRKYWKFGGCYSCEFALPVGHILLDEF